MTKTGDGHRRRNRVKLRKRNELSQWVRRLERDSEFKDYSKHHRAMAALKAKLGDPRPEGMTLSLIGEGDHLYLAKDHQRYLKVSNDPEDYIWETQEQNNNRMILARKADKWQLQ